MSTGSQAGLPESFAALARTCEVCGEQTKAVYLEEGVCVSCAVQGRSRVQEGRA